ncbi:uncharacterized protein LOC143193802 [Rhynchophorus ferrugineus]|uniref:uncharacterized protein LOC143193802 n=1 Tax=Rhynchophorus ferrugineus TaxID=354439 RepID=UPI003FCCFBFC
MKANKNDNGTIFASNTFLNKLTQGENPIRASIIPSKSSLIISACFFASSPKSHPYNSHKYFPNDNFYYLLSSVLEQLSTLSKLTVFPTAFDHIYCPLVDTSGLIVEKLHEKLSLSI